MGDEREVNPSPAPSTNPSEAGTKSIEIVHYDVLLAREKIETSVPPTPEPVGEQTDEPLRPPSPYQNNVVMTQPMSMSYVSQSHMATPARSVISSPYRVTQSFTPSRAGPPSYDDGSPVTPPVMELLSSRRQSSSVYSSRGSPYDEDNLQRISPPGLGAYMAAAAANQSAYYSAYHGPLESGSAALSTLNTTEDPFFKDNYNMIEGKKPTKLYKAIIAMIVALILFALYWIFVYPNLGFGTITKRRVEVAPNADMK